MVLCVDEKFQVQALERAQPMLPVAPGLPERRSHDYYRHGVTSLFAALEIATGEVLGEFYQQHTNVEFLAFLKLVVRRYPEGELHIVMDNYGTHTHPNSNGARRSVTVACRFYPKVAFPVILGLWFRRYHHFAGLQRGSGGCQCDPSHGGR